MASTARPNRGKIMNTIEKINAEQMKTNIPAFRSGDTVKVHVKVKEGEKERVQIFEGVVIGEHRKGIGSTFTVRKVSYGVGVERIFPYYSPSIEKIDIVSQGKVRRSKLYYLRNLSGKAARIVSEIGGTRNDNRRITKQGKAEEQTTSEEASKA